MITVAGFKDTSFGLRVEHMQVTDVDGGIDRRYMFVESRQDMTVHPCPEALPLMPNVTLLKSRHDA